MLINVDRDLCIGAAPCVAIAGNVFQLDDEGKAIIIGPSTDDKNTLLSAEACPVRAIFLYSDDGKQQIYPPASENSRPYVRENTPYNQLAVKPANDNNSKDLPKAA